MTDVERLGDLIRRTERRLLLLELQDAASIGLALALFLAAALLLGARVGVLPAGTAWTLLASLLVVAGWLALWAVRRRPSAARAAARIDAEYGLEDRVRSALACVGRSPSATAMEAALVADAVSAAEDVDPARVARYTRPAWLVPLLAGVAAVCLVLGVPERWLPGAAPSAADAGAIQEAGRALETRSLEVARRPGVAEDLRRIAVDQADLGAELRREPTSERDALQKLSGLDERIDRAARQTGDPAEAVRRARRRMKEALERAGGKTEPGDRADASARGAGESEAREERPLAEEARAAAEAVRGGSLGEGEKQKLREAARELAGELEGLAGSEELEAALESLADEDMSAEDLERLAEALEGLEARSAAEEAAEQLRAANQAAKQRVAGRLPGEPDSDRKAGPLAGRGSTNDRAGEKYEAESQPSTMESTRERPDTRGEYEARNPSERLGGQGPSSQVRGSLRGGAGGTTLFVQAAPGRAPSTAPYQEAYPRYRRSAERSIERSNVPPERRGVVRDYFDSINPDRGN